MVDGLIFRPGQLVRVDVQESELAKLEGKFADLLDEFLQKARAGREKVVEEANSLQVNPPPHPLPASPIHPQPSTFSTHFHGLQSRSQEPMELRPPTCQTAMCIGGRRRDSKRRGRQTSKW